jgi:hypothetical protein
MKIEPETDLTDPDRTRQHNTTQHNRDKPRRPAGPQAQADEWNGAEFENGAGRFRFGAPASPRPRISDVCLGKSSPKRCRRCYCCYSFPPMFSQVGTGEEASWQMGGWAWPRMDGTVCRWDVAAARGKKKRARVFAFGLLGANDGGCVRSARSGPYPPGHHVTVGVEGVSANCTSVSLSCSMRLTNLPMVDKVEDSRTHMRGVKR